MNAPLAEFRNVGMIFHRNGIFPSGRGETRALHGVDLALWRGETLALVGESGSGKSTLGRILNGALRPTCGSVLYKGRDLGGLRGREKRDAMRNIRMVFQDSASALNPNISIRESLLEPLEAFGIAEAGRGHLDLAMELLESVGLPRETVFRHPRELSGGQRQRVGIARALATDPELLICDEPVSSLDVSIQAQILRLLHSLREEKRLTCLFISHDMGVVRAISDRVCVLYRGHICEVADTEALYDRPLHPYTRCLLDSIPSMNPGDRGKRPVSPLDAPSVPASEERCPFLPYCPRSTRDCTLRMPELTELDGRKVRCFHAYDSDTVRTVP